MRILIADDERISTTVLRHWLEQWGFEVSVAHDGIDAWERITGESPPELAILDWMMPGIDGIELCRRIRQAPLRSPVYVIMLTTRTSREDLVQGLVAGADGYLTKPFDPEELRARILVGERTLALIANIKRLSGLLPICSYCKRIRSNHDYWEQLESYITEHTDALFTHGICPTCRVTVMEEFDPVGPKPNG